MAMASSLALLDNTPASALASRLSVAAPTPSLVASFSFRRRSSPALGRMRAVSFHQQMAKRKRTDMDEAWDSSSGLASMIVAGASCFWRHCSAPLELPQAMSSHEEMARRKRTDMDEAWNSSSGLASIIVAGASCFWRHCSTPLELSRSMSFHEQMAELKRTDLEEMSLRDSFSQLVSSMLVAGLCAAAAFGCSTSHFGVAYAAEGVAEESSTNFQRSCAGCHAGGGNILQPNATLFAKDLDRNGMANSDDIFQITYFGKGRMPGYGEKCTPRGQCTFGPRLSDSDIRALAEFVRVQADQGWTVK